MSKLLLEGGIIALLVLIGISIFIPSGNDVNDLIVDFENSVESGSIIEDGQMENVEVSINDNANFVSKINCKIANVIVNGLNQIFEIGVTIIRKVIN